MKQDGFNTKDLFGSNETLSNGSPSEKKKRISKRTTIEQKELMANYIFENPEMITHTSTKENEKELWKDMSEKLNELKPEKTTDGWKHFWNRWQANLFSKPEASLMLLDRKIKQFLNRIMDTEKKPEDRENSKGAPFTRKQVSLEEIIERIKDLEKTKYKLNLEVDDNDFKIVKYQNIIKELQEQNEEKRKMLKKVGTRKIYWVQRRRKLEDVKKETEEDID